MTNFHPLEVVGRGSETQLQVGENLNKLTQQAKGYLYCRCDLLWRCQRPLPSTPPTPQSPTPLSVTYGIKPEEHS